MEATRVVPRICVTIEAGNDRVPPPSTLFTNLLTAAATLHAACRSTKSTPDKQSTLRTRYVEPGGYLKGCAVWLRTLSMPPRNTRAQVLTEQNGRPFIIVRYATLEMEKEKEN